MISIQRKDPSIEQPFNERFGLKHLLQQRTATPTCYRGVGMAAPTDKSEEVLLIYNFFDAEYVETSAEHRFEPPKTKYEARIR
jgi:hypothetical protein